MLIPANAVILFLLLLLLEIYSKDNRILEWLKASLTATAPVPTSQVDGEKGTNSA